MKNTVWMVFILTFTGAISGLALSLVNQRVEPKVAAQQAKTLQEAVLAVVPGGFQFSEKKVGEMVCFEVCDEQGTLLGYSVPATGIGYGGEIRLIVGLTPDGQRITGLKILENVETPGLGGRISEADFVNQFNGLRPVPEVVLTKGKRTSENEIEAITGATISSRAVVEIVNQAVAKFREEKR